MIINSSLVYIDGRDFNKRPPIHPTLPKYYYREINCPLFSAEKLGFTLPNDNRVALRQFPVYENHQGRALLSRNCAKEILSDSSSTA